jgi:DNA helicase HerA-like ATPase
MTENPQSEGRNIGYIVGGGLRENLRVRLTVDPQQVQEGAFIVVESGGWFFYGLVTDLALGATDPRFADEQSEERLPAELARLLHGQTLYTTLEMLPALMMETGPEPGSPGYDQWAKSHQEGESGILPIKTIPFHHAAARLARASDVAQIFGSPDEPGNFVIGFTREQGLPVCVNLKKMIQRSAGIFGATGSGKSFLTRIVLAGLIQQDLASTLIFDMHNEYGWDDTASDTNEKVHGLRSKFSKKVRVVGLGRDNTVRGQSPDLYLEIGEEDITPEDIELLSRTLNLRETTPTTLEALQQSFGREWFHKFRAMKVGALIEGEDGKKIPAPDSVAFWANENGVNVAAAEGLRSKLNRVFDLPYVVTSKMENTLQDIITNLSQGKHVVLSFGKHENDLDYLLVTNILTRRIRETWETKVNAYRSNPGSTPEPRQLVVVVEEAHKLLNREMASQTTFSTIARELRKYYVTLLVIDQRPSQIYDEVMSQLGTRISGWLGDEDDIHAVLSGLAGRDALRGMLAHLQPKEEVLMLGWGVPMPILLRTRRYDDAFWKELKGDSNEQKSPEEQLKKLGYRS